MTTAAHTPGPWSKAGPEKLNAGQINVTGPGGKHVADIFPFGTSRCRRELTLAEAQANADLIVAAPIMLAALERALPELNRNSLGFHAADEAVRAALAKAKGLNL
jgi:hypothetical protein